MKRISDIVISRKVHDNVIFNLGVENFEQRSYIDQLNKRIDNQAITIESLNNEIRKQRYNMTDAIDIMGSTNIIIECISDRCVLTMDGLYIERSTKEEYIDLLNKIKEVDKLIIQYKSISIVVDVDKIIHTLYLDKKIVILWRV